MSQKQSQKDAVFTAVTAVLSENGLVFEENTNFNTLMNKDLRSQVNNILIEGFKSGTIDLDKSCTDAELKKYSSSLQSNWLRKDKRLNGGISYTVKNPGSRTGSGDESLKAMRALLATLETEEEKAEVQAHIDARLAEVQASKAKTTKVIDFSVLPAELAAKFQK
jgi:hypothetical protein